MALKLCMHIGMKYFYLLYRLFNGLFIKLQYNNAYVYTYICLIYVLVIHQVFKIIIFTYLLVFGSTVLTSAKIVHSPPGNVTNRYFR